MIIAAIDLLLHSMEQADVKAFQEKFGVPMADVPSLLTQPVYDFRLKFLHEELQEFADAHGANDLPKAADALVDLAYVLHGTALMMGLPWEKLWNEVHRKNMEKVRATHESQSARQSTLDVVKPEGWTPPDHTVILGRGPWPVFDPLQKEEVLS